MKITMSIQLIPAVEDEERLYGIIDEAIRIIDSSGMNYEVNAHSTIVEGEFGELMDLVRNVKEKIEKICKRFVLNVQFDIAKKGVTISEKTKKYR